MSSGFQTNAKNYWKLQNVEMCYVTHKKRSLMRMIYACMMMFSIYNILFSIS